MSEANAEGSSAPTDPPVDAPADTLTDAPTDSPADAPTDSPADALIDAPADASTDARAAEIAELKRQIEAENKRSSGRFTGMRRAQDDVRRLEDVVKQMKFNEKDFAIKTQRKCDLYEMQIEELKARLDERMQEQNEHVREEFRKSVDNILAKANAATQKKLEEQRVQLEQKCAQVKQKYAELEQKYAEVDAALKAKQHTEQLLDAEKKEKQTLQEATNTLQQQNKQLKDNDELMTKKIEFLKDKLQAQAAEQRTASSPKTKWQLGGQSSTTPSKPDGSRRAATATPRPAQPRIEQTTANAFTKTNGRHNGTPMSAQQALNSPQIGQSPSFNNGAQGFPNSTGSGPNPTLVGHANHTPMFDPGQMQFTPNGAAFAPNPMQFAANGAASNLYQVPSTPSASAAAPIDLTNDDSPPSGTPGPQNPGSYLDELIGRRSEGTPFQTLNSVLQNGGQGNNEGNIAASSAMSSPLNVGGFQGIPQTPRMSNASNNMRSRAASIASQTKQMATPQPLSAGAQSSGQTMGPTQNMVKRAYDFILKHSSERRNNGTAQAVHLSILDGNQAAISGAIKTVLAQWNRNAQQSASPQQVGPQNAMNNPGSQSVRRSPRRKNAELSGNPNAIQQASFYNGTQMPNMPQQQRGVTPGNGFSTNLQGINMGDVPASPRRSPRRHNATLHGNLNAAQQAAYVTGSASPRPPPKKPNVIPGAQPNARNLFSNMPSAQPNAQNIFSNKPNFPMPTGYGQQQPLDNPQMLQLLKHGRLTQSNDPQMLNNGNPFNQQNMFGLTPNASHIPTAHPYGTQVHPAYQPSVQQPNRPSTSNQPPTNPEDIQGDYKGVACVNCHLNWANSWCDGDDPCENCASDGVTCKRPACQHYEGKCEKRKCNRVHKGEGWTQVEEFRKDLKRKGAKSNPHDTPPKKRRKMEEMGLNV